ncbi:hypothetical protein RUND412_011391 [Rhizina undulata]
MESRTSIHCLNVEVTGEDENEEGRGMEQDLDADIPEVVDFDNDDLEAEEEKDQDNEEVDLEENAPEAECLVRGRNTAHLEIILNNPQTF